VINEFVVETDGSKLYSQRKTAVGTETTPALDEGGERCLWGKDK
jgi:hypothetical protein